MLKKSILFVPLLLSACMNLRFDGGEYSNVISIHQLAEANKLNNCTNVSELKKTMDFQYLYSTNRVWRREIKNSIIELKSMVDEIYNKDGKFSNSYCQLKMNNISKASMTIVKTLGEFQ